MKKNRPLFAYFITGIFLITGTSYSFGQTSVKKDTLAKYSFEQLSEKFYAAKPDSLKAVNYAKYYINKATREKDTLQTGEGYYYLSDITNDSDYFLKYWNKIIDNQIVNKKFLIIGNIELGDFHFHKGAKNRALKNYLNAQKLAVKNKNDSLKSILNLRMGLIKNHNREFKEAIKLYKSSLSYNKNIITKNELNKNYSILFNLSECYKSLKLYDSAYYYNNKIYLLAKKHKDSIIEGYSNFNNGSLFYKKKEYINAIDFLKKSIAFIKLDENYYILSSSYLRIGKSYNKLNDKKNALKYFQKVDSLFLETKNFYQSQKPAYKFLISHYKKENNDTKQLEYINKYIKVDSILNTRSKNISKNLIENYDIPNLIAERKIIENKLKSRLSSTKKWIIAIALLSILLLMFLIHQIRKRKLYKKRFQQLMNSTNLELKEKPTIRKEHSIPNEIVTQILTSLDKFEKEHHYISSETTLTSLAKNFETNSKYLSQIINEYKEKSFNNYINELRINYSVVKLKDDSRFRKYTIKAIANEVGFNTAESFSKAFYKNTGIKPSYFIKELESNN